MTAFLEREEVSDLDLIGAVRDGSQEAAAELYLRHHDAAQRYARSLADPTTAEDLVAEAFTKVFASVRAGGGPTMAFRPYLLRAVRNVHVDHVRTDSRHAWTDDPDAFELPVHDGTELRHESTVLAEAYASLPERWQAVLWHTAVEGEDHASVGRRLGLRANAVAALAFRSREGLRQAYLERHVAKATDEICQRFRSQLPAHVRGRLRGQRRERLDAHLSSCAGCTAGYLELQQINHGVGALLAPALLGASAASYSVGELGTAGTGLSGPLRRLRRHRSTTAAGVAAAAVLAVGAAAWAVVGGEPSPAASSTPSPTTAAAGTDAPNQPASPAPAPPPPPPPSADDPERTGEGAPEAVAVPIPSVSSALPTSVPSSSPDPTADPTLVSPSSMPSIVSTPPASPSSAPSPSPTPPASPSPDPVGQDLALGSPSYADYDSHHHLQMSVRAPIAAVVTIEVQELQGFTVHDEASYLPADCTRAGNQVTCRLDPGQGTLAIDVVVSGALQAVASISAPGNDDPAPGNDQVVFLPAPGGPDR